MKLRTLGGVGLLGTRFTQPKPLVLLAYLAVEGAKPKRHLAELFWPGGESRKSLSMALTRLRQGADEVVQADETTVWTKVPSDVSALLGALEQRAWQKACKLYTGAFLEGVALEAWGSELEEWVYSTREYLAERVQHALLVLAEEAAREQDFNAATLLAEQAYRLPGLAGSEVSALKRLYPLLCAGNSLLAPSVRKDAEAYGATLSLSTAEAKAGFKLAKPVSLQLPLRGTPFVGRDVELTELALLLDKPEVSLLTLVGPAGVGKTRLALQLASEQLTFGTFAGGVYFAPLDALSDAQLVPTSLIGQLGSTAHGAADPLEQLTDIIGERPMLLVLDNLEQLKGCAELLSALLRRCPNLKLLATSRERLRLEEEYVFPLDGLPYLTWARDEGQLDAVALFQARAQQVQPRFDLARELAGVLEICRVLEGSPLGIELAASRVRLMSCKDIAEEIARDLEFLTSTTTNIPERHRSLRAAFASSWRLLSAKEQATLAALSVFRGGFTRAAAAAVAGATIPLLAALVDKSLLRVSPGGRYDSHPLIAHYAAEKLRASASLETVRAAHTAYYLSLVQTQEEQVQQGQQEEVLRVFRADWDNFRLMAESILRGDDATLLRWIDLVDTFYDIRGAYTEALAFLNQAEARLSARPETRVLLGRVLLEKGWALLWLGSLEAATEVIERGLACLPVDRQAWRARGLNSLGIAAFNQGHYRDALNYWQRALALATEAAYTIYRAHITGNLGNVLTEQGDLEAAERYHLESLALYGQLGAANGCARELLNLALTYQVQGKLERAFEAATRGLKLMRELEYKLFLPHGLTGMASIAYERDNYLEARAQSLEALELSRETGDRLIEVDALTGLALASTALADYQAASAHSQEALGLAHTTGSDAKLLSAVLVTADLLAALGQCEHASDLATLVLQHPATVRFERVMAERLLKALKPRPGPGKAALAETLVYTAPLAQALESARESLTANAAQK